MGKKKANEILDYVCERGYGIGEILIDFEKLPEDVTPTRLLEALSFENVFSELRKLDFKEDHSAELQTHPGCESLMGVFLDEYKEAGGDMDLLYEKFPSEIDRLDTHFGVRFFVNTIIDLKNAGFSVDLDKIVKKVNNMVYFVDGGHRTIELYVWSMLSLHEIGAKVNAKKLYSGIEKNKDKLGYDGYLNLMELLAETDLKINYVDLAKKIIRDLRDARDLKNNYYIRQDHSNLIMVLLKKGISTENVREIEKLFSELKPNY